MTSAISYLSAAQLHADAVREGYRNPRPRPAKALDVDRAQRPRPALALRALLLARI